MPTPGVVRHPLPVPLEEVPPYRPTYSLWGEFVNEQHRSYSICPAKEHLIDLGIDGLIDYKEIGSGGFATVYSALEVDLDRRVAVKVLAAICTDSIIEPPVRKGGSTSSRERRPQRTPIPVGPSIL